MFSAARAAAERSLQILHSLKAFVKIRQQIVDGSPFPPADASSGIKV